MGWLKRVLFLLFAGSLLAARVVAAEKPVEIVSAEFGLFDATDSRETVFEPALVVPRREGQRYGWVIELRNARRSVSVREEYLLPSSASEQRIEEQGGTKLVIPLPRRSQVSQRQLVPVDGRIYGEWTIGSQEPAGVRQMDVVVEGKVAASFRFEVK